MIPVAPSLLVRAFQPDEAPLLLAALNARLADTPYSNPMAEDELASATPTSFYPVRWQRQERLCAWRARQLEGFMDLAVGHDSESLDRPEYQPIGLLRFLLLNQAGENVDEVAGALIERAEAFWRQAGVGYVKAFHYSTGYANFQAGLGALPGEWSDAIRVLTTHGYQFCERFYGMSRPLMEPIPEILPLADLNLVYSGTANDRTYQLYQRIAWVGMARVVRFCLARAEGEQRLAKLLDLQIDPQWRGQNIGKWLLRRVINDATLQGYHQLLVHVPFSRHAAISLLNQQGFAELNYRGYTLEKTLKQ